MRTSRWPDRGLQVVLEQVGGGDLALRRPGPATRHRALAGEQHRRAGRRPGRRGRASRRSSRGCGPAGRRSCPPPARPARGRPRAPARRAASSRRCATLPFSRLMPRRPGTLRRSTSSVGAASRSFISGISEWPPASSLASSPPSRERRDRLVERLGRHVVELGGDHAGAPAFPLASWMASQTRIGLSGMLM